MRKVTYAVATSVDGYIAGAAEAMDWLLWSEDASQLNVVTWKGVDTILMGRKTFDFALRGGGSLGSLTTYVFSRSMDVHLREQRSYGRAPSRSSRSSKLDQGVG